MSRSQGVEELRSAGARPDRETVPRAAPARGPGSTLRLLDSPLIDGKMGGNKARMSMKTKEEVKKSQGEETPHPARYSRHPLPKGEGRRWRSFSVYKNRGNEPKQVVENKGRSILQSAKTNSKRTLFWAQNAGVEPFSPPIFRVRPTQLADAAGMPAAAEC